MWALMNVKYSGHMFKWSNAAVKTIRAFVDFSFRENEKQWLRAETTIKMVLQRQWIRWLFIGYYFFFFFFRLACFWIESYYNGSQLGNGNQEGLARQLTRSESRKKRILHQTLFFQIFSCEMCLKLFKWNKGGQKSLMAADDGLQDIASSYVSILYKRVLSWDLLRLHTI